MEIEEGVIGRGRRSSISGLFTALMRTSSFTKDANWVVTKNEWGELFNPNRPK